jgi:hypothetical protein
MTGLGCTYRFRMVEPARPKQLENLKQHRHFLHHITISTKSEMGLNRKIAPSLFRFSSGCVLWGSFGGAIFKVVASFRGRPTGLPLVPASGLFLVPLGRPGLRFSGASELITCVRRVSRRCPKGIVCVSYLCLYIVMFKTQLRPNDATP